MHLQFPHLIYSGGPVDDPGILERVPAPLREALKKTNGSVGFLGAFHVRGAVLAPEWHSLRSALEGPDAFHVLYPAVTPDDLPIAEDAFGDQFLLRNDRVVRLMSEDGTVAEAWPALESFIAAVFTDLPAVLGYDPLQALAWSGGQLPPGQLLNVYPPFILDTGETSRSIRPINALKQRRYLADFASRTRGLPDGASVVLRVIP